MKYTNFKVGEPNFTCPSCGGKHYYSPDYRVNNLMCEDCKESLNTQKPYKKTLSWKWFLIPLIALTTFHAIMWKLGNYPIEFCIGLGIISLALWILFYVLTNIIITLSK
jgi:hypothetical protein